MEKIEKLVDILKEYKKKSAEQSRFYNLMANNLPTFEKMYNICNMAEDNTAVYNDLKIKVINQTMYVIIEISKIKDRRQFALSYYKRNYQSEYLIIRDLEYDDTKSFIKEIKELIEYIKTIKV